MSLDSEEVGMILSEHCKHSIGFGESEAEDYTSIKVRQFPSKKGIKLCYIADVVGNSLVLKADYYIGVDWLIKERHFIQVKPKLNTILLKRFQDETAKVEDETLGEEFEDELVFDNEKDFKELDFLKILLEAFQHPEIAAYTENLIFIDWEASHIKIKQKDDALTPFLVVRFLSMLKHMVRKGLKKSYYKVQENLNNRIKGKILVDANIKQNILKNRLTKTYCQYQQFGIDHLENRFLKKVLSFCSNYVHQNASFFKGNRRYLEQLINYCNPAFDLVSDENEFAALKNIKTNPFFKEYREAVKVGDYILKRFAYNISNTSESEYIKTPPFWIDMPKLFELYVYHHLHKSFPNQIKFQFATYGNVLDFLITKKGHEMVVDAKYKMQYRKSHIHKDIRQVAGYARLNKVYDALEKKDSVDIIDCLIVYPCITEAKKDDLIVLNLDEKVAVDAYRNVYKIGIPLPYIQN